jgi:hypothetical protein
MPQYVVTEGCYVPVGESTRFKVAGQVVTLNEKDAKALGGLVRPASKRTVAAQQVTDQPSARTEARVERAAEADGDVPTQSDLKADWVEFAVSKGESRDAAEAMTKAELVDKFGSE